MTATPPRATPEAATIAFAAYAPETALNAGDRRLDLTGLIVGLFLLALVGGFTGTLYLRMLICHLAA